MISTAYHIGTLVLRAETSPAVGQSIGRVLLATLRLAALIVHVHHAGLLVDRTELCLLSWESCRIHAVIVPETGVQYSREKKKKRKTKMCGICDFGHKRVNAMPKDVGMGSMSSKKKTKRTS